MVAPPGPGGKIERERRRVRLADVRPSGRMRLDAVARYLQDVAADDVREAGLTDDVAWVVRRTAVDVLRWPRYDEVVDVSTWCAGVGAAWAERRTSIHLDGVAAIETAAIWVSLDRTTMRPVPPSARFRDVYGPTGGDRRVRSKLSLPRPGAEVVRGGRTWPLRSSDVDLLGHVNNAVAWAAVEDEMSRVAPGLAVLSAEVEYRSPLGGAGPLLVSSVARPGELLVWLSDPEGSVAGADPAVSARVRTGPPGSRPPQPPAG
jgi:acyl-ACP thioesterase